MKNGLFEQDDINTIVGMAKFYEKTLAESLRDTTVAAHYEHMINESDEENYLRMLMYRTLQCAVIASRVAHAVDRRSTINMHTIKIDRNVPAVPCNPNELYSELRKLQVKACSYFGKFFPWHWDGALNKMQESLPLRAAA